MRTGGAGRVGGAWARGGDYVLSHEEGGGERKGQFTESKPVPRLPGEDGQGFLGTSKTLAALFNFVSSLWDGYF